MRLVAISDTHGKHDGWTVPDGDVLVHCGDLTKRGTLKQIRAAAEFLRSLPHARKVVIAGNHDFAFERTPDAARAEMHDLTYLEDTGCVVDGVRFWGSPWQPWFHDWAFNLHRGEALARVWARVPDETEVLLTHGPPLGHGDALARPPGKRVGCADLLARIREVRPKVHCFGHIHEGAGVTEEGETLCVNASICDLAYEPHLPPRVLDRTDGGWRVVR